MVQYIVTTSPHGDVDLGATEVTIRPIHRQQNLKPQGTTIASLLAMSSGDAPSIPNTNLTITFDDASHGYSRTGMKNLHLIDGKITGLNGRPIQDCGFKLTEAKDLSTRIYYDRDAHYGVLNCSRSLAKQIEEQAEQIKQAKRLTEKQTGRQTAKTQTTPKGQNHPRKHKRMSI